MTTTLTVHLGGTKPDLKGVEVSSWAKDLLEKTTYQKNKEELNLVILTPADLGFTTYPTTTELFARAKEKGYDLCPAEVGPRLVGTLEEAGYLYIAHEPITDSDGFPHVFYVERDDSGTQWLYAGWTSPGRQWVLGHRIVFTSSKSLSAQTLGTQDTSLKTYVLPNELTINGITYRKV